MANNSNEIQRLYDISTTLDSNIANISTEPAKYEALYEEILQGSKGGQKSKMLVAQFIPKYLPHFQKFADKSINSLIDLCEEDDLATRVNAIRALPIIAKITPDFLPKVADILGQLLQAEQQVEVDRVKQSLVSLLLQDLKGTLTALFSQTLSEDEGLRVKAIAFIFEKVVPMREEINKTEDSQKSVAENVKRVLPHVVSAKEFQLFTDLLCSLKIYSKGPAASELLELLADINANFTASEEGLAKLTTCIQSAAEFYLRGATSEKFLGILATKALPVFATMKEQHQVELIQRLTEIAPHLNATDAKTLMPPLYDLILTQIPLPPTAGEAQEDPKINFSIVESALYIFHTLAAKAPGLLRGLCGINVVTGQPSSMSTELAVDKKKDLDARLKHLEETTSKNYIQPMEVVRKSLVKATTPEEIQKKNIIEIALKATHNVLLLAQNLSHKNPIFGAITKNLVLSFTIGKGKTSKKPTQTQSAPEPKQIKTTKVAPPTKASSTTTTSSTGGGTARPAFGSVYVPPNRAQQGNGTKKRPSIESVPAEPAEHQKKHKGRGSSKFHH
eukprot:Phypoly_transcript_06086.p1 GENE.Phypoly_transcript_06086~~Phypoly_transcript_06086.p1  ORF type:complete len:589 (-),score=107.81 Phypoly_transcript_06086:81-1763(-)